MIDIIPALWATVFGIVTVGVLGLLIGSFLNVVVYRVPIGASIVSPPSACPQCGNAIRPWDNIPVLSWLALRGKCRDCRTPISKRYPLVEAATSVFFAVVAFWRLPEILTATSTPALIASILELIAFLYLAGVSVALALIDLDVKRLPNSIVLPAYLVGAVLLGTAGAIDADGGALLRAAIGAVALFVAYLVMAFAYPGGMGLGDVKLAGVLGLFLGYVGWGALIVGAFAAFLLGGLFALALVASRRAGRKSGIPFGPWMLAGAWIGILFGNTVWGAYLSLLGIA
ncbi:prepilin peptidase [Leifsonia sp. NPDC058230]|uniref:prepilin peptidase n=1 Tax=Leifsonia sp. NPDC058230 TaxID=3346391 RepID=UPI0036D8FD88